jgi:hypothetical protein
MRDTPIRGNPHERVNAPFRLFAMNTEPFNRLRWTTYDAGVVLGIDVSKFRDVTLFEVYPTVVLSVSPPGVFEMALSIWELISHS